MSFFPIMTAAAAPQVQPMQPLGWIFMIVSIGFVVLLTLWCYAKVLALPSDPTEMSDD